MLEEKQKQKACRGKLYPLLGFLRAQRRKSSSSVPWNNVSASSSQRPALMGCPFFLSPFPPTALVLFLWLPASRHCITNSESGKSLIPLRGQKVDSTEQKPEFSLDYSRGAARAMDTPSKKVCSATYM